jgi:predicted GNAT superfamily acetyltransferase
MLIFSSFIRLAGALILGAIVVSLAGRLYQNIIVDRVTHMSESDLGIQRNPEVEDMISRIPRDIEKFKTETYPEMNRQWQDFSRRNGGR